MSISVIGKSNSKKRTKRAVSVSKSVSSAERLAAKGNQSSSAKKFALFWDLMDTIDIHGYLRASMGVIGRSTVGAWWSLIEVEDADPPRQLHRKKLLDFYNSKNRDWSNIRDFQSIAQKLMIGAMYLRFFGRCAYKINRDAAGHPIGLDFLSGYVAPNVDKQGYFKSPAFIQYPTRNQLSKVEFEDPNDIVYITNPDWRGSPVGGSDIEALSDFAVPIDIYLQVAAREYLKNRDRPEAFFVLPSDISDEAFDDFVAALNARYAGPRNVGRSPIAVAGELKIEELSKLPQDLPYQQAREDTREEIMATSGVAGAKLGLSKSLSSANMRESRREFHESTMIPLFRMIEIGFYEQIHIREFGITGWMFSFNSPDFLTAVERATVHMRYRQMEILNANEIRHDLGKKPRTDPGGDDYTSPTNRARSANQGSPPEGREQRPDAPSQTGEPTTDDQDPPRGDQHDDTTQRLLQAVDAWRSFARGRVKRGRVMRMFIDDDIPSDLADVIQESLVGCETKRGVDSVFDEVTSAILETAN